MEKRHHIRIKRRPLSNKTGAAAVEYVILLLLVACFLIAIVGLFGSTVSTKYDVATDAVRRELTF